MKIQKAARAIWRLFIARSYVKEASWQLVRLSG